MDPSATAAGHPELTFHWLYERVQGLIAHSIYQEAGGLEKWSLRVGLLAAVIGVCRGLQRGLMGLKLAGRRPALPSDFLQICSDHP